MKKWIFLIGGIGMIAIGFVIVASFRNGGAQAPRVGERGISPPVDLDDRKAPVEMGDTSTPQDTSVVAGSPESVPGTDSSVRLGFNNADQAVESSTGSLMVWVDGADLELATRGLDGSVLGTKVIASGKVQLPAITRAGETVVVGWVEGVGAEKSVFVRVSNDGGFTFGEAWNLGGGDGISLSATDGSAHAVWHRETSRTEAGVMHSRYANGSWGEPERIDQSPRSALWASVASESSVVLVAWRDNRAGEFSIWSRRSTDGGTTWDAEQHLVADASGDPDACVSPNGIAWVAHHGLGSIGLMRSQDGGKSFGPSQKIGNGFFAHVACSDDGALVAWEYTTEPSHLSDKENGWALFDPSGLELSGGRVTDGRSLTTTVVFLPGQSRYEMLWTRPDSDRSLDGELRRAVIVTP